MEKSGIKKSKRFKNIGSLDRYIIDKVNDYLEESGGTYNEYLRATENINGSARGRRRVNNETQVENSAYVAYVNKVNDVVKTISDEIVKNPRLFLGNIFDTEHIKIREVDHINITIGSMSFDNNKRLPNPDGEGQTQYSLRVYLDDIRFQLAYYPVTETENLSLKLGDYTKEPDALKATEYSLYLHTPINFISVKDLENTIENHHHRIQRMHSEIKRLQILADNSIWVKKFMNKLKIEEGDFNEIQTLMITNEIDQSESETDLNTSISEILNLKLE